jgi:hypothetical protein
MLWAMPLMGEKSFGILLQPRFSNPILHHRNV